MIRRVVGAVVALGGIALVASLAWASRDELGRSLAVANPIAVAIAATLFLDQTALVALIWREMMILRGGRSLSWLGAYRLLYRPALAKYLPGGGIWAVAGTAALAANAGLPAASAAFASTATLLLVAAAGALVAGAAIAGGAESAAALCGAGLAAAGIGRGYIRAGGLAVASWLPVGAGNLVIAGSLAPLTSREAPAVVASAATGWLAGLAAIGVPAGLGARDGVQALTLGEMLPPAASLATALLVRVAITLSDAGAAAVAWLLPGHDAPLRPD